MKRSLIAILALFMLSSVSATPLSIIDSEFVEYEGSVAPPAWVLTVRGDNDASYTVFGSEANMATTTEDGSVVKPVDEFSLVTTLESQSCRYELTNSPRNDLYQYDLDSMGQFAFWKVNEQMDSCYDSGGALAYSRRVYSTATLTHEVFCVRESKVANVGEVAEGQIDFEAAFSLQRGDEPTKVKTISTLASNDEDVPSSVQFTDGGRQIANVRWIGGTTFGEFCPSQDSLVSIEDSGRWYTADRDDFTLYNEQYRELQELIDKIRNTDEITSDERRDVERLVNAVNGRGMDALVEEPVSLGANTAGMEGSTSVLSLPRGHLIYAPDFEIVLSAQYVGFVYESSRPEIVDAGFNSCSEGGDNDVFVTVENVGDSRGTFDVGLTCQSGINIGGTTRSLTLEEGQSGTVTVPISLDLDSDQSRSCTAVVQDRRDASIEDREAFTTTCQASTFCETPGELVCFGETEKVCDDGSWVDTGSDNCLTSVCNRNDVCEPGLGESFEACGGKLASENDCATCNLNDVCESTESAYSCPADCGPVQEPISAWIYYVGGALLAVVLYFSAGLIKPGKKGKKRRKK